MLIDESSALVATATSPHTFQTPKPVWSEQDPHEWWTAIPASIRAALQQASLGGENVVAGGGTKGALWRQILASVLEAELVTVNTTEGAAFGAALLADVRAGAWAGVPSACAAGVRITGSTRPDTAQVEAYRKTYPLYRELYPALKPGFDKI